MGIPDAMIMQKHGKIRASDGDGGVARPKRNRPPVRRAFLPPEAAGMSGTKFSKHDVEYWHVDVCNVMLDALKATMRPGYCILGPEEVRGIKNAIAEAELLKSTKNTNVVGEKSGINGKPSADEKGESKT